MSSASFIKRLPISAPGTSNKGKKQKDEGYMHRALPRATFHPFGPLHIFICTTLSSPLKPTDKPRTTNTVTLLISRTVLCTQSISTHPHQKP